MKQKIVIKVSMPCERSRSKAMTLAARADGVISMAITGDAREKLEVVGDGVDPVRLVSYLRRKVGHAEILQVEEVKDKKPEEEKKKPEEPKLPQPVVVHPPPQCYPGGYHYYRHPPPMVVCEEPSSCPIM
ncbi:heavy metal-associated isoprenylated plant protein 16-like [Miscanthus floridulus]|uniref:heavy metal-associated isoprenylated plant protein 16-like n=1 Tax=Miscanthus floridulus TaxID=154761 RepID=UPI003459B327